MDNFQIAYQRGNTAKRNLTSMAINQSPGVCNVFIEKVS
jgi:hypothetical protein